MNTDGARFVVWAHDVIGDETIFVEHPVGENPEPRLEGKIATIRLALAEPLDTAASSGG